MQGRATTVGLVLGIALCLTVIGCGGPSAQEKTRQRALELERLAKATRAREKQHAVSAARARFNACDEQIGDLLEAEQDLGSRLDVGLSFTDYSERVGDVSAAYGRVRLPELKRDRACLLVAVGAERALNKYVAANNRWNKCIQDFECSTDAIEPDLQESWADASLSADRARNRLDGLKRAERIPNWSSQIPASALDVDGSMYGAAAQTWCGKSEKPAAAEACLTLKQVLQDGVAPDEIDDLDKAVKDLDIALGLTPSK